MPASNIEIVRTFFAAYARGDREGVAAAFHPELEWRSVGGPLFGSEVIRGREAVLSMMFERIPEALAEFRVSLIDAIEVAGGQVVTLGRYEGRGVASGAPFELTTGGLYRFDSGAISWFREFATRDDAMEAATAE